MFCFICGEYTFTQQRKPITDFVRRAYLAYFKVQLGDQDKPWAPHIVCKTCTEHLRQWTNGKRKCLKFGEPMIWREQINHSDDCYFCSVNVKGINSKNRNRWVYPNLRSARRPVPHSEEIPVPIFTSLPESPEEEDDSTESYSEGNDSDFPGPSSVSSGFSQAELNDLIRDLSLPKKSSELLASRLAEKQCLLPGTKVTVYRKRETDFLPFFTVENQFVFCMNVEGLLMKLGVRKYTPSEWRLFIDSSKRSLKCVLLHNGNIYRSIPIGHSVSMRENQHTIATVLEKISYRDHQWVMCVDLKMVNFLLGQQGGYTKYPCFICLWDSRAKDQHWVRRHWPLRESMTVGEKNIVAEPLVDRNNIILPPLHIKLGLMKQFIKALNRDGTCFGYICTKFPALSKEKIKAGIFDGPQIRQLINDHQFQDSMNDTEAAAWSSFCMVVKNFLGNYKSPNSDELVENMLTAFCALGCNMSIKLHYLHSHLDRFPDNLGDVSEEQGERFHQELSTMEERYRGRWDIHMMADYCWSIHRECPRSLHRRKSQKRGFCDLMEEN